MAVNSASRSGRAAGSRRDPKPRSIEGTPPAYKLKNRDPNRVYVGANPYDPDCGLQAYLEAGWEVEVYRKDGPTWGHTTPQEGTAVTYRDQVLVSKPRDEVERERQEAIEGLEPLWQRIRGRKGAERTEGWGDPSMRVREAHGDFQE